jgi:hypothetical protein|tara:strand:- start:3773 stop:4030 length:258 start_codon:yes stop_codon:yes gene_type:complete
VFDSELQALIVAADQIAGGVGPCVKVRTAAQRLAEVAAGALSHVVDKYESELVTAIDMSEETEQTGDVGCAVLIETMKAYQGIQE